MGAIWTFSTVRGHQYFVAKKYKKLVRKIYVFKQRIYYHVLRLDQIVVHIFLCLDFQKSFQS